MSKTVEIFVQANVSEYINSQGLDFTEKEVENITTSILEDDEVWATFSQFVSNHVQEAVAKKDLDSQKHEWESTDSEGKSMECLVCGTSIGFATEEWSKEIDNKCHNK